VKISGTADEVTSALITGDSKVIATSSAVTVNSEASVDQLTAIDGASASVTATTVADTISHLSGSKFVGSGVAVKVTDVASVDQMVIVDQANGAGAISGTIRDSVSNILTAAKLVGAGGDTPLDARKFAALFQVDTIQITGWTNEDLSLLTTISNTANIHDDHDALVTKNDLNIQLVVDSDKLISLSDAVLLNPIDGFVLENNGTDLTISSDAFTPARSATHLGNLASITSSASSTTAVFKDAGTTSDGSVIDLKNISSVSGLSAVTVVGDTGANIIQLSSTLSTSGTTSVDLKDDSAVDKLYFNVDSTAYKGASHSGALGYTTVTNFDTGNEADDIGLFYGDTSGIAAIKRTGQTSDGVAAISRDRTYMEDDTNLVVTNGIQSYDSVSEVKAIIAGAVSSVTAGADRLAQISYGVDETNGIIDAYVMAANLADVNPTESLTDSGDFDVISVARILGTGQNEINIATNSTFIKTNDLS
jgi:hypothetical protein